MAEYTPGPWESHDVTDPQDSDCGNWVVEIPETPDNTVIRLWFGDMENNSGEDIANANLVAAAPDLLAACEGLVDLLGGSYDADTFAVQYLAAQLSIAKARGEVQL